MGVKEYTECRACGFVLTAEGGGGATPLHWDACPSCDGTEFVAVG